MFKKVLLSSLVLVPSLLFSNSFAQETVLNVSTWLPPTHVQNAVVWPTWASWVEEATEGRVKVRIENSSNDPKQLFEMVEDGVTDAAFSFHGFIPGRFPLQEVVELPGLIGNAESASVAHWRTYEKYLKDADEHDGLELLALFTHGPAVMQTRFEVTDLNDLKGKKIRIGGGVQEEIGKRLQVTPILAAGNAVYELLQTKVADGAFMPVTEQKAQKLHEVAPYVTIFPKAMYLGSFVMFISPEFLDSISEEDRAAILSVSGEKLSAMAGKAWDEEDLLALDYAKSQGGTINILAEDDPINQAYIALMKGIDEEWIEKANKKGIDGQAALEMLRAESKAYYENQ